MPLNLSDQAAEVVRDLSSGAVPTMSSTLVLHEIARLSSTKTSKNMHGHSKMTRLFSIKELDLVRQGPEALHG